MSEKRFTNVGGVEEFVHLVFDNETARTLSVKQTVKKLNEQQATIDKQDEEIKKLKKTERSWRKIHCCNKESNNCGIVIEQQNTIEQLKAKLREKEEDEQLYANEILELREANKEFIQFKDLGGDY